MKVPLFELNEEMHIEPRGNHPGFSTRIVGYKLSHCLILSYKEKEEAPSRLKSNDIVWVRCSRKMPFLFMSKVLKRITDPIPLIFLEYPQSVEEINFRRSERKKTFIKSEFFYLQKNRSKRSWTGYILDISDSGCLMWDDFVHLMDRNLSINFRIPWTGEKIQAKARVVRTEVTDTGIRNGLKFIELDSKVRNHLKESVRAAPANYNAEPLPETN